ncbi:hypothetical protein AF72_05810 [Xylella taiwanensis]|uniref:Uncharacterized protein n=1 Tax=Xylella taiwanensis TaxID=1444770 RepID=Z9JL56_9GAMM|nr:hypothetical protein AF72_05810 [Xylella taiwanensis]
MVTLKLLLCDIECMFELGYTCLKLSGVATPYAKLRNPFWMGLRAAAP